jgi:PPOX class probable F420-dependent enzyme
VSFAAPVGN